MQVFHLPGDNAVSGGRSRYKLTAESGSSLAQQNTLESRLNDDEELLPFCR